MNNQLIALFSILLFQTIRSTDLLIKKDENKALPLKGNRPGANLWSDEVVVIGTNGQVNGGFADDSENQVRRPIGQWGQPTLPLATDKFKPSDQQSFPPPGIDNRLRPDGVLTSPEKAKERGWHSWNSPSLDSENEWSNSWNEPSLAPLPQQNWGNNNGPGKPCCGGKNSWGFPSPSDQSNNWNEPSGSELLLPSIGESEREDGWSDSKWSSSQNGASNSMGQQDSEWGSGSSPQWGSQTNNNNNNNNKPVCNCDDRQNQQNQQNQGQEPQRGKYPIYPNYPSAVSYAPIRPSRPQKQQAWNHFENLPWSSWERGIIDKKLPKIIGADTSPKVEEIAEKLVETQESSETEAPTDSETEGETKNEE